MPSSTRRENKGHVYYLDTNGHLQGKRLNVANSIRKCLQQIQSKLRLKVEQVAGSLITTKIIPGNEICSRKVVFNIPVQNVFKFCAFLRTQGNVNWHRYQVTYRLKLWQSLSLKDSMALCFVYR